jgi:hypothetical protein
MVYIHTGTQAYIYIYIHNQNLPSATLHCFHLIHHCSLTVLVVHWKPTYNYLNGYIAQLSVSFRGFDYNTSLNVTFIFNHLYYPRVTNVSIFARKSRLERINRPNSSVRSILEYF